MKADADAEARYLGDGVMVEQRNGQLVLWLDGRDGANDLRIYLEPEVYEALTQYVAWLIQNSSR